MGAGASTATASASADALFGKIDTNHDGLIDLAEAIQAAKNEGARFSKAWPEAKIKSVLETHSKGGKLVIGREEWGRALAELRGSNDDQSENRKMVAAQKVEAAKAKAKVVARKAAIVVSAPTRAMKAVASKDQQAPKQAAGPAGAKTFVATKAWIAEAIETLNELRSCHGASPIEWSEEEFVVARKIAEKYASTNELEELCGPTPPGCIPRCMPGMLAGMRGQFVVGGKAKSGEDMHWGVKHGLRFLYSTGTIGPVLTANSVGVAFSADGSALVLHYRYTGSPSAKQAGHDAGARRAIAKLEKKLREKGDCFYGVACPANSGQMRAVWQNLLAAGGDEVKRAHAATEKLAKVDVKKAGADVKKACASGDAARVAEAQRRGAGAVEPNKASQMVVAGRQLLGEYPLTSADSANGCVTRGKGLSWERGGCFLDGVYGNPFEEHPEEGGVLRTPSFNDGEGVFAKDNFACSFDFRPVGPGPKYTYTSDSRAHWMVGYVGPQGSNAGKSYGIWGQFVALMLKQNYDGKWQLNVTKKNNIEKPVLMLSIPVLADDTWHTLAIAITPGHICVQIDGRLFDVPVENDADFTDWVRPDRPPPDTHFSWINTQRGGAFHGAIRNVRIYGPAAASAKPKAAKAPAARR
jgi:hypothetical protein